MKLIDKDALVAEINTRIMEAPIDCYGHQRVWAYNDVKSILDNLEVEEDVDAEIVEVEDSSNSIYAYTHLEICTDEDLSKICKVGDKAKVIIIKQK